MKINKKEKQDILIAVTLAETIEQKISIKRIRIAIWVLTLGYAVLAISIILLVYGNLL